MSLKQEWSCVNQLGRELIRQAGVECVARGQALYYVCFSNFLTPHRWEGGRSEKFVSDVVFKNFWPLEKPTNFQIQSNMWISHLKLWICVLLFNCEFVSIFIRWCVVTVFLPLIHSFLLYFFIHLSLEKLVHWFPELCLFLQMSFFTYFPPHTKTVLFQLKLHARCCGCLC